jgi:hypothetical protein
VEGELQLKVVDYIRRFHPHASMFSGLTHSQGRTPEGRRDAVVNGYMPGACDLLITNSNMHYNGLAIELKHPAGSGELQDNQVLWLERQHLNKYKVVVSNDYDMLVKIIDEYFDNVRIQCPYCKKAKHFRNDESLNKHVVGFHNYNRDKALNQ